MDLTEPTTTEYTHLSASNGMFSKLDYILVLQASLND